MEWNGIKWNGMECNEMEWHGTVREKGKGGIMVVAGHCIDYVTCEKAFYQN